jgi:hypothetical protein
VSFIEAGGADSNPPEGTQPDFGQGPGVSPVSVVGVSSTTNQEDELGANPVIFQFAHTVPVEADHLAVSLSVTMPDGASTVNDVQVNGTSMTRRAGPNVVASHHSQVWSFPSPPTGVVTIAVAVNNGAAGRIGVVAAAINLHGVIRVGSGVSLAETTNLIVVDVPGTTANDLIVDAASYDAGVVATPGSGQTQVLNLLQDVLNNRQGLASFKSGGGAGTMRWNLGAVRSWTTAAVKFTP